MTIPPKADRRVRTLFWYLLHRVPVEQPLGMRHEEEAWKHCRLSGEDFYALKAAFPAQWQAMEEKRERRREFFLKHGSIPEGWTPPNPKVKGSGNYPAAALAARKKGDREHRLICTLEGISHRQWNQEAPEGNPSHRGSKWTSRKKDSRVRIMRACAGARKQGVAPWSGSPVSSPPQLKSSGSARS